MRSLLPENVDDVISVGERGREEGDCFLLSQRLLQTRWF